MASTGVTVADTVVAAFNEFKKASNPNKFIFFEINGKEIVITHTSGSTETYEDFLSMLPADGCRYAVYKMDFTTNDGRPNQKIVNVSW